jgi:alternate signal-mediated exported protein
MGGAGSLAYWTATGTANGGSITSGSLSLTNGTCDTAWKYASGTAAGTTASLIVPGDSITKSCTFTVGATGDHLTAKLTAPATLAYTKAPAATTDSLTVASTYNINRATPAALVNGDVLNSADNGKVITAKFVVTMPYGSTTVNANDTQSLTATLNQLTVTLTQDQSSGNNPNA